ncbi:MAG: cytochrome c oxidase assembly protein [Lysobacter sp.]
MRTGRLGRWSLAGGLVVLGAAWLGPLPEWSRHSFAAHMAMHMAVVAVAAPLLAVGLAGSRLDPVRRLASNALPPAMPPTVALAAVALSPIVASVIEFLVVWAWHAPALHHAARHSTGLLAFEQASFLAVGLLVWLSAFGGGTGQRRQRAAAGIGGLLLTSMHMTLLGVLLALASRPLYPHDATVAFGLTALQDQHLGGVLMLLFGGVAYMAGALVLLLGLLRERREAVPDA